MIFECFSHTFVTLCGASRELGRFFRCPRALAALSVQTPIQANNYHVNTHGTLLTGMKPVLLSTALVEVADIYNNYHTARAILDNGSQRCIITQSLCDLLQTPVIQSTQEIRGIGNSVTNSTQICDIVMKSCTSPYITQLQCFVLPTITSTLGGLTIQRTEFNIPHNVKLADPQFYQSQDIDILIGADKFWDLLNKNRLKLSNGAYLNDTKLGWIISGPISFLDTQQSKHFQCNLSQSIDSQLRKFWELEEIFTPLDTRTDEERACEEHFIKNTTRNIDGRFCVRIPFKKDPRALGESYSMAEKRFLALEHRLKRNFNYKNLYTEFIHEYIRLGHMSKVEYYEQPHYFLCHHGVFREHSTTTKLRVVFDASAATNNNISLNDLQMTGPPIQGDLLSILLRFRFYKYTACADVEKMYRQCLVDESQRDLQLILWRDDPSEPLGIYRLNTVTYGTASAPFLSCRCLKEMATGCKDPHVIRVINEDFYVDDMITTSNDKTKLLEICQGVEKALRAGCFPLRKWMFNFDVNNVECNRLGLPKELTLGENVNSKTLGLGWYNSSDQFHFNTQFKNDTNITTKRYIMSHISQIFDPLGLLSPFVMMGKILLQQLWLLKLGWDDEVPVEVKQAWERFSSSLPHLSQLRVPRHVVGDNPTRLELHIFCHASVCGYGACIYVRSTKNDNSITVRLYCSKRKVAPLKSITIPKLELLGALTGARLYNKLRESLRYQFDNIIFWSDSTIVLGWLRMAPNLLNPLPPSVPAQVQLLNR
jgi:hypothetical protein